jgi:hypothetical protein
MATPEIIGPLAVTVDETEVSFRFCDPMEMALEVPPLLADELRAFLHTHPQALGSRATVFDLADVPAISSRQLGVMLTVRQIVTSQDRLAVRHASDGVRRLLTMTKMEQFFEFA